MFYFNIYIHIYITYTRTKNIRVQQVLLEQKILVIFYLHIYILDILEQKIFVFKAYTRTKNDIRVQSLY